MKEHTPTRRRTPTITPLEKRLMLDASLPVITGQVLWLDAADKSTVRDSDGDNAATGTGGSNNGFSGAVATWVDKSGSGFNLTAPGATQSPSYANTLNGHSVITFDGVNDILRNTSASITGDDITIFIVFDRTNGGSARSALFEIGGGSSRNAIFYNNTANKLSYYLNSAFYNYTTNYVPGPGNYALITQMQDTTAVSAWTNGANQVSATGPVRSSTTGIYLADDSTGGDSLQGHIAEFIVYDRDLSADERHDVETYLAGKWGLSITNNAPVLGTNTGTTLLQGAHTTITSAMLSSTDSDNSEPMLQYKITDLSDYGTLTNTNTGHTYILGEYFTQGDINNGYIRYTHNNSNNFTDSFSFTVSDQLATTSASTFNISITPSNHAPQFQGWTLVSSENFEAGATGWNDNTTTAGGTYFSNFLGRHSMEGGIQSTFKTYSMTGSQDYTVITFDMYKIDSWDGEFFKVFINDNQIINLSFIQTSFQSPVDGSSGAVSYSVQELTPFLANFAFGTWNEQIFRFTLTVSNSAAANLKLGFSSTLDQGITDEAWGVDNINIYEVNEGATPGPLGIVENSANGTYVGQVTATDQDIGQTITYSIVGGTGAGVFSINSTTGVISVASALDYETTNSYTLSIRATDNGTGSLYDSKTITINVLNLPENTAPVINALGPLSVAENAANNTVLGTVTSTDAESNTVTYSISSGNTDGIFAINASTGAIRVSSNTNLNYDFRSVYTLTILATDNGFGNLTSTRSVTINVTNVNEAPTFNIPQSFLNQNPYLRYNATTGNFYQFVGTTANYATASAAAAAATLNGVSGHLATITSATENTYVRGLGSGALWLGASDSVTEGAWIWAGTGPEGGGLFSSGSVAQNGYYTNWLSGQPDNVSNADHLEMNTGGAWNDDVSSTAKAYVIEWEGSAVMSALGNGPFTLAENPSLNQSVGFVHARDADAGDTLTYSITGGSGSAHFSVNSTTGEITVTNPSAINYESATSYALNLRVQDVGGLFSTQTVTINITNVNEAPTLPASGPFSIAENSAINSVVGSVTATDPDAADILSYSIIGGTGSGIFAINSTTGQITLTGAADYEGTTSYTLDLQAQDAGGLFSTQTVIINITDVNEAPNIPAVGPFSLAENAAINTAVGSISATDPDAGQTISYSIVSGNGDGIFSINASTGSIYVLDPTNLDFETTSSYGLTIRATDNGTGSLFSDQTVIINIANVNEVPTLPASGPFSIAENSAVNSVVGTVTATDPDSGDILTHSITAGTGSSLFAIDSFTGQISLIGAIDYENASSYTLDLRVQDVGGLFTTQTITINVSDINEVPDFLAVGALSIAENSVVNTVIGNVTANDPDSADTLTYSITGGTGSSVFAIDSSTGQITLTAPIDFESTASYSLDLRVQDAAGLFSTQTVTIDVTDINEAPIISPSGPFSATENSAVGTVIGSISASDADSGDVLGYSIIGGTGAGLFAIDATTGQITLSSSVNYELSNSYTLNVRAQDSGGLFDTITLTIGINDANDAPDGLSLSSNNVIENSAIGTLVGHLTASDEDISDTHTYSLVTNPSGTFTIVGNQIFTGLDIDYETNTSFSIVVRADDGNGGTYDRTFIINVGDLMDTYTPPANDATYIAPQKETVAPSASRYLQPGLDKKTQESALSELSGLQIIRENVVLKMRTFIDSILGVKESYSNTESSIEDISSIAAFSVREKSSSESYTNLREALYFLQQMEDSNGFKVQHDSKGAENLDQQPKTQETIHTQFADVMTYHQQRAAHLRKALTDA